MAAHYSSQRLRLGLRIIFGAAVGTVAAIVGWVVFSALGLLTRQIYEAQDWRSSEHTSAIAGSATIVMLGTWLLVSFLPSFWISRRLNLSVSAALGCTALLCGLTANLALIVVSDVNSCGIYESFPLKSHDGCQD
jgi:hypothetical protein